MESRFSKTIACSYVILLTTYLAKKTMFKVSNKNTRKIYLLISKITLKTSQRRHMTTSYLPEVTVQSHALDSFFLEYITICNQVPRPVISTIVDPYMLLYENEKSLSKYLIHEKFKMSAYFISEKTAPKIDKFSTFYLIFKGSLFQYHKVRHPNFL